MFSFIPQRDAMDCGPACLSMLCCFYNQKYTIDFLREKCFLARDGVSLLSISEAAKNIGFETFSAKVSLSTLLEEHKTLLPCILHWDQNHFVVLHKVSRSFWHKKTQFHIADPGFGKSVIDEATLKKHWADSEGKGIALFLNPTDSFYEKEPIKTKDNRFKYLLKFLTPYP